MPFSKRKKISNISKTTPDLSKNSTYCGNVTTQDPRVFGPIIWDGLHIMAQNYPDTPSNTTKESCIKLIESIPHMLPCSNCGCDFREFSKIMI